MASVGLVQMIPRWAGERYQPMEYWYFHLQSFNRLLFRYGLSQDWEYRRPSGGRGGQGVGTFQAHSLWMSIVPPAAGAG
ncbi:MAG: hypothetical protein NZ899_09800 [Thermoguttaceae bacterium]|nr:hypothetical protein [Thermoguttaceae bacterium]